MSTQSVGKATNISELFLTNKQKNFNRVTDPVRPGQDQTAMHLRERTWDVPEAPNRTNNKCRADNHSNATMGPRHYQEIPTRKHNIHFLIILLNNF